MIAGRVAENFLELDGRMAIATRGSIGVLAL
jgi:hypothetical protein